MDTPLQRGCLGQNTAASLCQYGGLGWKRIHWEVGIDLYSLLYTKQTTRTPCIQCVCVCCRVRLCDPMDCSPPGSSVHGILQARILVWVAISSSKGSSQPRDQTYVSCVSCVGGFSYPSTTREAQLYIMGNSIPQSVIIRIFTTDSLCCTAEINTL